MLITTEAMTRPLPETYPNNIQAIRNAKGITQEPMYKALKITQSAYSQLERGLTDLSIKSALTISRMLGCDPIDLSEDLKSLFNANVSARKSEPKKGYDKLLTEVVAAAFHIWWHHPYRDYLPEELLPKLVIAGYDRISAEGEKYNSEHVRKRLGDMLAAMTLDIDTSKKKRS